MANTTGKKFGGRMKGTPNRDTRELRERIQELLDGNFDKIMEDLHNLEPKQRIDAFIRLLEYSLPKLNRTEHSATLRTELSLQEKKDRLKEIVSNLKQDGYLLE